MPCRTGFRVSNASGFRARVSFRRRRPRGRKRSETRSVSLKPRLGNIATPGRVCLPHNETYDCRIYPNGIGCLRRRSTRRRLEHRPADRTGAGIPDRFGIRARRSSGPQRSVSDPGKQNASATCIFRLCCRKTREKREGERRSPSGRCIRPKAYRPPGRQNRKCGRGETGASASPARPCGTRERGKPRRAAIPATRRKTRENGKKRDEFPGYCIRPEMYRAPGDRTGNAAGERDRSIRESSSALRSPRARKARATGLRAVRVGLSRQKCRTNPEHLPNPITHFVTPAVLGGVFGSYFPMAGNPLAWSRLENACTWHIRYINAYNRSAKYFSIPKPG